MLFETGNMSPKIYRPTMEEFRDFPKFVAKIEKEDEAHNIGICKIIPPDEWIPRKKGYALADLDVVIETPVKQKFHIYDRDFPGCFQTKSSIQNRMHVKDYYKLANSNVYKPPKAESSDDLERKYWKSLQFNPPIYGCDVASGFSDPDLDVWNISKLDTILKYLDEDMDTVIQGVNSPYLYFGMWRATFSWHVEDMDLYGINMVHYGAPKTWYCVPPKYGHLLEKLAKEIFPNQASYCSNFMRHKTCLISPKVLKKHNIPYNKIVQKSREIIIVFPYAYHCGFNHGFNIAESTNFASERWIEYGKRHRPCDCHPSRVKFTMDSFVKRFQPNLYEKWMQNLDIAPHPEDPPDVIEKVLRRAENPRKYAESLELKTLERLADYQGEEVKPTDTVLDVYQHVEFRHIEILVDPKTFKIYEGKEKLESWFQRDELDVKQLINDGVLFKSDEAVLPGNVESSQAENVNTESIQTTNHTRVMESSRVEKMEKVNNEFIQTNYVQTSIRSLIGPSTVVKIIGNINNAPLRKRPNECIENSTKKNVAVYKHSVDGWKIQVYQDNWTLLENQAIPDEAKDFVDLPIKDLIDLGVLIKTEPIIEDTSEIDEKKSKIMSDFLNENNKTSPRITKESKVKMKIFENNKNAYEVVTID